MQEFIVGAWHVQPSLNVVRRGSEVVRLEPKVMRVLVELAEHPGEVVTREALIASVWPDVFVTDDVLHRAVRELRRVFGDSPAAPAYIATIRKRGYRLIAPTARVVAPSNNVEAVSQALPAGRDDAGAPARAELSADASTEHRASVRGRVWPFPLVAAAVAGAVSIGVLLLASRAGSVAPLASARFVPLVSGALNETDPAISPDGRQVAFVQRVAGEHAPADIFVRDVESGRVTQVTDDAASDRMPAWSPDGSRLAFVRATPETCEIFVLALARREETRVGTCRNPEEPHLAWTADGRGLLMSEADAMAPHQGWRIVRLDLDTGAVSAVTNPAARTLRDHGPAVSPDGRTVAFIRRVSGGVSDIYVAPVDGGAERRVTFDEADLTGAAWSRDGRSLVYSSDRAGGYSLWRVPVSGGEPQMVAGGAARMKHPVVDRAGRRVVYENWQYEINIWRAAIGESDATIDALRPVIRTSDLWNLYPHVSPDGSSLAFVSTQSGSPEVWIADADGSRPRQLTRVGGGVVKSPRWSPDGRRIVYLARGRGGVDLHVVDAVTGVASTLGSTSANETAPAWSADGASILFGAAERDGRWNVWAVDALSPGAPRRVVLADAVAAQPSPDGRWHYFTRADRRGLWRAPADDPGASELVVDAVPVAATSDWLVAADGAYFVQDERDQVLLRFVPATGGAPRTVATLPQLSWPGFSIAADGRSVLYARWDRRESNIMALEF